MNQMWTSFVGVALLALQASSVLAGNLITVGPGQQHSDIPMALAVAQSGDLILVDPQGTPYSPIQISTGVSILSSVPGQKFMIAAGTTQPGIEVSAIAPGESVTIYEVDIQYPDSSVPAIRVLSNTGSVRFRDVQITTLSNLTAGPTAMIEVDRSLSVWLSQINATGQRLGVQALNGNGVNGLLLRDSGALVQSSTISAFHSLNGSGGNGIQLDRSKLWLTAAALGRVDIWGGNGASGGHAIFLTSGQNSSALGMSRDIGTPITLHGGTGTTSALNGMGYWFPRGSGNSGGVSFTPALPVGVGELGFVYSSTPDRVSIGAVETFGFQVAWIPTSSVGLYGLVLGTPLQNWANYSPNGFIAWDPNSLNGQVGGGRGLPLGAGPAYPRLIPNNPNLIGTQLSLQGWIHVPGFGFSIGEPRMVVVVP